MSADRRRGQESLVFATRRAPLPLDNGARIRAHHLLTGLAAEFHTTLVCFEHARGSPDGDMTGDDLRRRFPEIEVIMAPGLGANKRQDQARSMIGRRSWSFGRYRRPAFASALASAVQRRRPCIVHFDDLGVAQFGPFPGTANVYSSHNVEQRIVRLGATTGSLPRRLFNAVEARKVRDEEERVWRSMDISLAVSPVDGQAMRAGGARRVELCPNGTDPVSPLPVQPLAERNPLRILFVGSGAYAPYERGLAWFVREVVPRVRALTPMRFDVVGQPPARPITAEGVSYLGRVPTVAPWYESAHVVVVPVFEGSGTRLKLLEAVAYGRPVVSTRLGAEGLPLRPDEHYLQASDAEAFAAAVVDLADRWRHPDVGDLLPMLSAARQAIEPLLWSNIVARLVGLYRTELRALREPSRPAGRVNSGL